MHRRENTHRFLTVAVFIALLCASNPPAEAQTFTTAINVPSDIAPNPLTSDTQLNLFDGGSLGNFFLVGETSGLSTNVELNVFGGVVGNNLQARPGGDINITGGQVGDDLTVYDGGVVTIRGGAVGHRVLVGERLNGQPVGLSTLHISDGTIGSLIVDEGGKAIVSGGHIGPFARIKSGGTLNIFGGTFGDFYSAREGSTINFFGSDFRLNGQPVSGLDTPGQSVAISSMHQSVLTGTLVTGEVFIITSGLEDSVIWDDVVSLHELSVPPAWPNVIDVPLSPVPAGLRTGQTLNLSAGGAVGDDYDIVGGTLNIAGGTVGYNLEVADASINLSSGSIGDVFGAYTGSAVLIEGGTVGWGLSIHANASLRVTGGTIGDSLSAGDFLGSTQSSVIDIEGGVIGKNLSAYGGGTINIRGGSVGDHVHLENGGTINLSGGSVGEDFDANSGGTLNIIGKSFTLNGIDITSSLTPNVPLVITDRGVTLAGLLSEGSPFDFFLNSLGGSGNDSFPIDATLTIMLTLLEGDLNGDGFVGVDDLNIVLLNWNQTVTPGDLLSGDPTGEGFVGVDDLNIVLVNWNNGTPPGAPSDTASIPEPGSGVVLLGLGWMMAFRRR